MFTYSQVEEVYIRMHDVQDRYKGLFRARIKHMQRIMQGFDLIDKGPGKGKKLSYDLETLTKLAYCLEFVEFSIDPTAIVEIFIDSWDIVKRYLLSEMDGYFVFYPKFLSSVENRKIIGRLQTSMVASVVDNMREIDQNESLDARMVMINLTRLRKRIAENIAAICG